MAFPYWGVLAVIVSLSFDSPLSSKTKRLLNTLALIGVVFVIIRCSTQEDILNLDASISQSVSQVYSGYSCHFT